MRFHDIRRGRRDEARPAGRARRAKRGGAPGIEALEARVVLATSTWSGAVSNLWSVGGNWNTPPAAGNALVFPTPANRTANVNDLAAGTSFSSVTFTGTGYAITGNQIGLTGPVSATQATGADALDLPIAPAFELTVSVANPSATLTLGGVIGGVNGLQKTGLGTADLTAANTYTGTTTVGAGTLLVDGTQAGSAVIVDAGATLGGVGTVGAISTVGGGVKPGDGGPGILTDAGPLTLSATSNFSAALNGTTPGTGYSQLQTAGPINLAGAALNVTLGFTPTGNQPFTLIHNSGGSAISGTFAGLPEGANLTVSSQTFKISYVGGSGHDVLLTHLVTSTTTLSASNTSPTFGTAVTFTATVTNTGGGAGIPGGSVQFVNGTTPLGTGTLNSAGVAVLTTSALPVGTDSVTAVYAGSSGFAPSTSAATTVTVSKAPTATSLTVVPTSSVFGQSVTLTATVAPTVAGIGTPTGTVEFLNGATEIQTIRLNSSGVATLATTALPVGTDSITALYESDNDFATSTSPNVTATVTAVPTTTTLAISPTQPALGQSVTLTATVVPTSPFTGTPTGSVTFLDGTTILGSGTLSGGVATLATTGLVGGPNTLTARYNTDNTFATSTSAPISVTLPQGSSTTGLAISPNPSSFGQSVTLTARVTGIGGGALLPTGTVQFFAGATSLGTAPVNSGIASLTTTSLPIGTTSVTADYLGTSSFSASVSPAVVASVSLATTGVAVTSSIPNPGPTQTVVLTATVASGLAGNTPTGTVNFFASGVDLGSATLTNGVATLTLKGQLPVGNQFITAQYLGDANNAAATSAALPVPVGSALERYINGIYINTLGRPVDTGGLFTINTGGLSGWLTKFIQGGAQRRPIVEAILHSKETRQFGVQATYTHLAGKQAAHPQLANAFVGANGTTLNLNARVLGGPAYFAAAGSTIPGFLAALGTDVLGAPLPDATLAAFTRELEHGVSRQAVARQLLASPSGQVALVNGLYQRILGRLADPKGLATSIAILDKGNATDRVLANLLASGEYFSMFLPKSSS